MDPKVMKALQAVAAMVVETVAEFPGGAPESSIYLAIQSAIPQFSLSNYQTLVAALVRSGKVTRSGACLFPVAR